MAVTRCICRNVTFAEFLARAKSRGGQAVEAQNSSEWFTLLQDDTGLGTGCGTCIPYARVALRTGVCDLPVMTSDDFEQALSETPSAQAAAR